MRRFHKILVGSSPHPMMASIDDCCVIKIKKAKNPCGIRVFGKTPRCPESGFDIYGMRKVKMQLKRYEKARSCGLLWL